MLIALGLVWLLVMVFVVIRSTKPRRRRRHGLLPTNGPLNRTNDESDSDSDESGNSDDPPPCSSTTVTLPASKLSKQSASSSRRLVVRSSSATGDTSNRVTRIQSVDDVQPTENVCDREPHRPIDRRRGSSTVGDQPKNDSAVSSSSMRTSTGFGGSKIR
jgi:hypothetical protein